MGGAGRHELTRALLDHRARTVKAENLQFSAASATLLTIIIITIIIITAARL
jgi:hypothetical protein